MTDFLINHYRYNTMNSWNNSTSYANKVKIHGVIPNELTSKVYELMESDDFYEPLNQIMSDWEHEHDHLWQAGFNGRSSGYIVLYQGYNETKTIFKFEGSQSKRDYADGYGWLDIEEAKKRGLYKKEIKKKGVWPGRSTDQGEDFSDWDTSSLKNRVELVQSFDKMCDEVVAQTIWMAQNQKVVEETIMIPKKVKHIE